MVRLSTVRLSLESQPYSHGGVWQLDIDVLRFYQIDTGGRIFLIGLNIVNLQTSCIHGAKRKGPRYESGPCMLSAEVNQHRALVQRLLNYSCRDLSFSNYVRKTRP